MSGIEEVGSGDENMRNRPGLETMTWLEERKLSCSIIASFSRVILYHFICNVCVVFIKLSSSSFAEYRYVLQGTRGVLREFAMDCGVYLACNGKFLAPSKFMRI